MRRRRSLSSGREEEDKKKERRRRKKRTILLSGLREREREGERKGPKTTVGFVCVLPTAALAAKNSVVRVC